jgi:MoxR-like ATPase
MALSFAARARGESLAGLIDGVAREVTRIEEAA